MLLASGTLAGCGSSSGSTGTTHTITDAKGRSVAVPDAPTRVLTLSEPTLDAALVLGVTPVGTTSGRGQGTPPAYLSAKAATIPVVASVSGPNLEQVATVHPDLILYDGTVAIDDAVLSKLTQLAPTVFISKTGENWQTALTAAATALNRGEAGKKVLADYAAQVGALKTKLTAKLGDLSKVTVSIVRWGSSTPSLLLKEINASRVISDLGLARPASQNKEGPGHSVPLSLENLDQIDADWVFFGTLGGATNPSGGNTGTDAGRDASVTALKKAAADTPGFSGLKSYQLGHIIPVDGTAWTSAGGPLAEGVVLSDVQAAMIPN